VLLSTVVVAQQPVEMRVEITRPMVQEEIDHLPTILAPEGHAQILNILQQENGKMLLEDLTHVLLITVRLHSSQWR
jgi:hypothetical protein